MTCAKNEEDEITVAPGSEGNESDDSELHQNNKRRRKQGNAVVCESSTEEGENDPDVTLSEVQSEGIFKL